MIEATTCSVQFYIEFFVMYGLCQNMVALKGDIYLHKKSICKNITCFLECVR